MPESFNCPSCNAPLSYERGQEPLIKCKYCGNTVLVPESLREKKRESSAVPPVIIASVPRYSGLAIAVLVVFLSSVLIGSILLLQRGPEDAPPAVGFNEDDGLPLPTIKPTNTPTPTPTPSFATEVLRFGSQGINPGQFDGAAHLALDGNGKLYVADYDTGRVQVFDEEGNYLSQVAIEPNISTLGLAAGRDGSIYVSHAGRIVRYDAQSGERLAEYHHPVEGLYFHHFTLSPTNQLVAVSTEWTGSVIATRRLYYELTWLDLEGNHIRSVSLEDIPTGYDADYVAVDGLSNVYAYGRSVVRNDLLSAVYMLDAEGNYLSSINGGSGGASTLPGDFSYVQAVAVDGWGRIYVAASDILVFTPAGRYIDEIPIVGGVVDMAFNANNELFVSTGREILKLTVPEP